MKMLTTIGTWVYAGFIGFVLSPFILVAIILGLISWGWSKLTVRKIKPVVAE